MGFINQNNCLVNDSIGNIYVFNWSEHGIKLLTYTKTSGQVNNKIVVEDSIDEYDVTIDENDTIYLVCQKEDGSIILLLYDNDTWDESIIAESFNSRLYNLNIIRTNSKLHIIYCVSSNEDPNRLKIYHHYLQDDNWVTHEVEEISKKEILNSFQIITRGDEIILGYYNLIGNFEEVFIKVFNINNSTWTESIQITSKQTTKLYIDLLLTKDGYINITYSEYKNGNLTIKFEKYKLLENNSIKICENVISNPSNCMYPTLVYSQGMLWNIWTEYDNVVSCFSDDNGLSWSLPHLWTESKNNDFTRYKFISNDVNTNINHNLNHSFGFLGSEITFIGFGNIEDAVEIPLKSKKKEKTVDRQDLSGRGKKKAIKEKGDAEMEKEIVSLKENMQSLELHVKKLENYIKDSNDEKDNNYSSEVAKYANKIEDIEKRLDEIESYIFRRRRNNPFFSSRE
ncbi:hypothetical protein [Brassicibacter mesophilus]|uniref:hypothetical protein n=1 Tax=Brassicibacter mesophilus TaxID=745119 RepID=UPI003D1E9A3F